jgi:hypothetical protein
MSAVKQQRTVRVVVVFWRQHQGDIEFYLPKGDTCQEEMGHDTTQRPMDAAKKWISQNFDNLRSQNTQQHVIDNSTTVILIRVRNNEINKLSRKYGVWLTLEGVTAQREEAEVTLFTTVREEILR